MSSLYTPQTEVRNGATTLYGEVLLPLPKKMTAISTEESILLRKSIREWADVPLTIDHLSMILWAAQGVVEEYYGWLRRSSPSAGATYPLEIYVVVGNESVLLKSNEYLQAGIYKYDYKRHSIKLVEVGDKRTLLWDASLNQDWVRDAPVNIVICAVYERTTSRYGERGIRYVILEAGHVGQNIYLMSTSLGLGTVAIGAFYDDEVAKVISAAKNEKPIYIFPIGVPLTPHKMTFEKLQDIYNRLRK
ncbi:MAG: SagB/ThcOx family dehydrogenase [Sulfolobales archaeon]|nr:SagB/ThcOx family dehydrogenase [Sulfolobales archaeon]